jgi:hypothetical protein
VLPRRNRDLKDCFGEPPKVRAGLALHARRACAARTSRLRVNRRLRAGMALRDFFGLPVGGVYRYNDPHDSVVMGSARGKQADDGIIP